jgi:hypothetical protein
MLRLYTGEKLQKMRRENKISAPAKVLSGRQVRQIQADGQAEEQGLESITIIIIKDK